jgi:hypothetical protein
MSRASRRARGRQIEAARGGSSDESNIVGATRQVGAIRFGLEDKSLSIDVTKLETPTQTYDADFCWLDYNAGRLSLVFAKNGRGKDEHLESCLEIRFPPEDFAIALWRSSLDFFERLEKYVAQWPAEFVRVPNVDVIKNLPVSKFHSEWATVAYMAHAGTQAGIDFYQMSPAALSRFSNTRSLEGLRLRPVVRVQMSTFDMAALARLARPVQESIASLLPASHQHEEIASEDEQ